jgi:O-antigen/teichoic acid export membrane protein
MVHFQVLRHLLKEGFWVVVGQAMLIVGSLVGVRLLTEALTPDEYGKLALGMTIATFLNQIILGPLGQGVMRFYYPSVEKNDISGYLHAVRKLMLIATMLIFCLILTSVISLIIIKQERWVFITITSLIFASISGYNSILSGIQNSARQRLVVALHQGSEPWLRSLFAILLINWLGKNSAIAMTGYVSGVMLVVSSQSIYFLRLFSGINNWANSQNSWSEKIWKYSYPFSIWGGFTWLQIASDRWALGLFRTTEEVGMYTALFQIGYYPISVATGVAVQFLAPIFFQQTGDGTDNQRNATINSLSLRLTALSLVITCIMFCFTYLLQSQIFQIFVYREYKVVSYLLPWVVLSGGIFASSQTISLNLMSQARTQVMLPFKIITALLGTIFNFAGGYLYGVLGVVMASMLFSISCLISMTILSLHKR